MPKTTDTVEFKNDAYLAMEQRWELIDALLGGTLTMRAAGNTWLHQHPREKSPSYESRLANSFLFGAYKDALQDIVAKPFSKEVIVNQDLPDRLLDMLDNVDMRGSSITQFSKSTFKDGVHRGLVHILVDFPQTSGELTLAEERGQGIRPFFLLLSAKDLTGWQWKTASNGKKVLSQIRFKEVRTERVGAFETAEVNYIRVIGIGYWELWKEVENKDGTEYQKVDEGPYSFRGIPLVSVYFNEVGNMKADPTLEELAWMNLAHWNSDSDRRNVIKFASVGLLFIKGLSEEEKKDDIIIGPNQVVKVTNEQADMKYVEYAGNAIDGGRQIVLDIEARMKALGLRPFLQKASGTQTATEKSIDTAQSNSQIQAWIRNLETGLEAAFSLAYQWMGLDEDPDFAVSIFNDFGISMDTSELDQLLKARLAGQITHETYLKEIKRRALLDDETDIDAEIKSVQDEELPEPTPKPEPVLDNAE